MPDRIISLNFLKYNAKLECPFVIYDDFECLTINDNKAIKGTYQEHISCGYLLNIINGIDIFSQPHLYRGENCMDKFVEQLKYRGSAHVKYNLDYSYFKKPIFFHNFQNHDAHLLFKRANELNKKPNENKNMDVVIQKK